MIRDDITTVWQGDLCYMVGNKFSESGDKITKIKLAERNGQMAPVPYIEIWNGDLIWIEFDASHATQIIFADPDYEWRCAKCHCRQRADVDGGKYWRCVNCKELERVDAPKEGECTCGPHPAYDPDCPVHPLPF